MLFAGLWIVVMIVLFESLPVHAGDLTLAPDAPTSRFDFEEPSHFPDRDRRQGAHASLVTIPGQRVRE